MVILFGPTSSKKFAPDYEKAIVLDSKELYRTSDVTKITVEDVLQASELYLNS